MTVPCPFNGNMIGLVCMSRMASPAPSVFRWCYSAHSIEANVPSLLESPLPAPWA